LVAHYDFEQPEDPSTAVDTSTITHVPKNSSGSLFPTDLGDVLQGKALADDGNIYDSVQTAVDNASGYVFIGPGTFNESVTVSTDGMMIEGSGYDTLIDGGTSGDAVRVEADDIIVSDIAVRTNPNSGNSYKGVYSNANNLKFDSIIVTDSDSTGMDINGSDIVISNCTIESSDHDGINYQGSGPNAIIYNCRIESGVVNKGIQCYSSDDVIVSNCVVIGTGNAGIETRFDSITIGNRVHNVSDSGIEVASGDDSIVANNRVSDSTSSDIRDSDGTSLLDDNLTGSAN
jgi:parallel beta-helix repeat protein